MSESIGNSGIDDAWIEADVLVSSKTWLILNVKHYKRALLAEIYIPTALYEMVFEFSLLETPKINHATVIAADEVEVAYLEAKKFKKANSV